MRMDNEFRSALPIVADFFMGVVNNFFYPGAQGAQGASLVVDGIEGIRSRFRPPPSAR